MAESSNNTNSNIVLHDDGTITKYASLRVRRKTSSQWSSLQEIIPNGEPCLSIDTGEMRVGDGSKTWSQLGTITGINPQLFRRELVELEDGTSVPYTRILIDDGEIQ